MRRVSPRIGVLPLLVACVLATGQCSSNSLAPFQPEITNATDSFQMQATHVSNVTTTLNYTWDNTGTQATVNHSTSTSYGKARLIILDAGGATVYDKTLMPSLTEKTAAGGTGKWTIRVVLSGYSGSLNFRVQKV